MVFISENKNNKKMSVNNLWYNSKLDVKIKSLKTLKKERKKNKLRNKSHIINKE